MFQAKTHNPPLAIALMLGATAFIATSTAFAKALGTGVHGAPMHPLQITFGRFLFAGLFFALVVAVMRPGFTRVHWGLHLQRTGCGWGGVTLMFAAVAAIPLADATAISFLNPVFAMILAIPLLGERVGPVRWAAAALAFCGALVLLRPAGTAAVQPGALLALGAALALGLEVIFIKRLAGREGPLQVLLVNNGIGLAIAGAVGLWVWRAPEPRQWLAMAGVGLSMALAQSCYINAVARAEASFVVPFSYATLLFAALIDALVFGVLPLPASILGAAIIIAGGGLLAWREGRARGRATSPQPNAE
ncbi:MAG: EamA family transporter [Rhodobacteraceae bacterium]|nr:MAG: EamA family transporter [Paracoccaceae bacterium]